MIPVIQQGHVVDVVAEPVGQSEIGAVCLVLRQVEHIPVGAELVGEVVHVYGHRRLSTLEEVTVLRAFCAVTDARLAFHGDVIWTAA